LSQDKASAKSSYLSENLPNRFYFDECGLEVFGNMAHGSAERLQLVNVKHAAADLENTDAPSNNNNN
jgi:hypothetical protein